MIKSYLQDSSVLTPEERQRAIAYKPAAFFYGSDEEVGAQNLESYGEPKKQLSLSTRTLRFPGTSLNEFKKPATDPSGEGWVSTFEAFAAHLQQRIYRSRL